MSPIVDSLYIGYIGYMKIQYALKILLACGVKDHSLLPEK